MYLLAGLAVLELMLQMQRMAFAATLPDYLLYALIFLAQMLALVGAFRSIIMDTFLHKLMYLIGMGLALEHVLQHERDYLTILEDGGMLPSMVAVTGMLGIPLVVPLLVLLIGFPHVARSVRGWL